MGCLGQGCQEGSTSAGGGSLEEAGAIGRQPSQQLGISAPSTGVWMGLSPLHLTKPASS